MLNYSDFEMVQGQRKGFKFKKLMPLDEQTGVYADASTKKKYFVTVFTNQHQFVIFHSLCKKEIFGNIAGLFKKKNLFYCFSHFDGFQTLSQFIDQHRGQKQLISQLFCLQLIEQMIQAAKNIEATGYYLKILTPFCIMLTQTKNNQFKFQLKFPLSHNFFEGLSVMISQREIQFCAPEIMIMMDSEYDLNRNKFSKSVLYSIGLILLYCFGYRIKSQERILALKKSKQFKIFLKAIRKEIKLFQQGKFISKIIKILTQQNQFVRDNIETFLIKLHSPQLESLRKFIFKPAQQSQKQTYIPTIYSDYSDHVRKSGLNRTIEIRLSSMSNSHNQTHQKSERQGQEYNLALFATFKKSPQIKEVEEDQREQDPKLEAPSPIQIQIDWDDEDEQNNIASTPKKENTQKEMKNSNKACYDFPEEDLKIAIRDCDLQKSNNKERFLFSEGRSSKNNGEHLKKSSKSNDGSYRMKEIADLEVQIQSKSQLKNVFSDRTSVHQTPKKDKYHVMVQQEPDIIKYSQKQYNLGSSPKLSRKKISKAGSNDLQDMTLIEDEPDDQEEILQIEEKNGTHYEEIKAQFNKKSEAIFITLLVNFLIYKIIDYFVQ